MQSAGLRRLPALAVAVVCGLALFIASPAAAAERGAANEASASKQFRPGADRHRPRSKAARRAAAQRRKARRARHRLARQQRRNKRRHAVAKQIALTKKRAAAAAAPENPEVLFRGDFEAGFDGWHVQSISSRASLFSSGTFQGSGAARFEVQDGDVEPETGSERSEVEGPTFDEGQDLYFRDAFRIPAATSYDGPWQIIQQLHEEDWDGSPGIAVFLEPDDTLRLGRGDGDETYWETEGLSRDRWHDLVYRVYLSQDSSTGFVEVWLDGVQQILENGETRAYGETIQTSQTYLKAGIYRSKSSTGTSLVEHDQLVVGTSLAAVTG